MGCRSESHASFKISDFWQSRNDYSLGVNLSRVRIRSLSEFGSPDKAGFGCIFGRLLYARGFLLSLFKVWPRWPGLHIAWIFQMS